MRITNNNFEEKLDLLANKDGKNRIYYRSVSFKATTVAGRINIQLATQILVGFLTTLTIVVLFILLSLIVGFDINSVNEIVYIIIILVLGYAARLITKELTQKFYKNQINEFINLVREWNTNRKTLS